MGIFDLFRTNGNTAVSNKTEPFISQNESGQDISEQIFLDNTTPEPVSAAQRECNDLRKFLDIDFYRIGFSDGYDNHSEASCSERLECIRQEFILVVETVIAQKREFISTLGMHISNIGESSETDTRIAEDKIQEVNAVIEKLVNERENAVNSGLPPVEGLVMKPVSQYRSGFLSGQRAYGEEKFFAQSTGLFN